MTTHDVQPMPDPADDGPRRDGAPMNWAGFFVGEGLGFELQTEIGRSGMGGGIPRARPCAETGPLAAEFKQIIEAIATAEQAYVVTHPLEQKLQASLKKQWVRCRLFNSLLDPEIEPTNNIAERGQRPAIVNRKIS